MPFCQNCGKQYQDGNKFCNRCGAALPPPETDADFSWNAAPAPVQTRNQYPAAPPPAMQNTYAPAPLPASQPANGGSKPWEQEQTAAGHQPTDLSQVKVFRADPAFLNSKRRIPVFNTIYLIGAVILFFVFTNEIDKYPSWYADYADDAKLSFLKGLRIISVCVMIGSVVTLISYLSKKDLYETARIEIKESGVQAFYVYDFAGMRQTPVIPWTDITNVNVSTALSVTFLSFQYRDPYTRALKGTGLMRIDQAYACADIIREKAGIKKQ